jgi:sec-independent protein translocase protein TatB
MFDVGYSELLVIAIVLIVVVGPKDLPKMLRAFGKAMTRFRQVSGDFRRQFDDALKEAELDEVKKVIDSARSLDPRAQLRNALNPLTSAVNDIKRDIMPPMVQAGQVIPKVSDIAPMPPAAPEAKPAKATAKAGAAVKVSSKAPENVTKTAVAKSAARQAAPAPVVKPVKAKAEAVVRTLSKAPEIITKTVVKKPVAKAEAKPAKKAAST